MNRLTALLVMFLPGLVPIACGGPTIPQGVDIPTKQGKVHGSQDGATRIFLGIPFAAPPTGDNRFRPPQPPVAWSAIRDATTYGPVCPQFNVTDGSYNTKANEDCLTLNVWTPAPAPASPLPVMVWIHGGAFTLGSGSEASYAGQNLSANTNVVVVTINYRLGPLGFLAHAALASEDAHRPSSGNYGLLDQQQALHWVRDNIASFGGDPGNVTLFGESAGGISVCGQLVSPGAEGLFQRAVIESGPCVLLGAPDKKTWEAQGAMLAQALKCGGDDAAVRSCLRAKSAPEILSALPRKTEIVFGDGYSWTPDVDGVVLPDTPLALLKSGRFAKVPLIVGANKDEGTLFFALGAMVTNEMQARATLGQLFSPSRVDAILGHYKLSSFPTVKDAALQMIGDLFVCDARRVARLASAGSPTYFYHFTRAFQWIFPNLGAFHSAEVPFVFQNPYEFINLKPEELPLSNSIEGYWSRHAAKGDPNSGQAAGTVAWPAYHADSDAYLQLDLTVQAGTGLRKAACDFWDTLAP